MNEPAPGMGSPAMESPHPEREEPTDKESSQSVREHPPGEETRSSFPQPKAPRFGESYLKELSKPPGVEGDQQASQVPLLESPGSGAVVGREGLSNEAPQQDISVKGPSSVEHKEIPGDQTKTHPEEVKPGFTVSPLASAALEAVSERKNARARIPPNEFTRESGG